MADGNLTPQEQSEIEVALDQYASSKQFGPDDAKEFFCDNWATIKQGLEFLKGIVPPPGPSLISAAIWIGNKAHDRICGE